MKILLNVPECLNNFFLKNFVCIALNSGILCMKMSVFFLCLILFRLLMLYVSSFVEILVFYVFFFCFWTLSSSSFRMLMIFDFGHTKVVNLNYLLPMHTHTQKARHCNTLHVCATELNKKKNKLFFSISVITENFSHFVASDKKNSTFLFVCYFVVTFNEIMCMCVSFLVCVQWNQTSNNTMIVSVKRKK